MTSGSSVAEELAYVAENRRHGLVAINRRLHDIAAGAYIVECTPGLVVTDFYGNEWNENSKDIIAANEKLARKILERIERHGLKNRVE